MIRRGIEFTTGFAPDGVSLSPVTLERFAIDAAADDEHRHAAILEELTDGLTPEDIEAAGMGTGVLLYQKAVTRYARLQNMERAAEEGRALGCIASIDGTPIGVVSFGFPQEPLPESRTDIRAMLEFGAAKALEFTVPRFVPTRLYSGWLRTPILEQLGISPEFAADYTLESSLNVADASRIPRVQLAGRGSYGSTPALTVIEHVAREAALRRAGFRSEPAKNGVRVEGQDFKGPVEVRDRPKR